MKLEIADIATNEKKKLSGFKVLWVFPFYLKYISTGTHIQLCKLKEMIQTLTEDEPKLSDFDNHELQSKLVPLLNKYILTALLNSRLFSWFFYLPLKHKIKGCGHYHLLNLYITIHKLNEPAFFLSYWKLINQVDHTILKEAEQS